MGYVIYLNDHDFNLKAEHFAEVEKRWRAFEEGMPDYYTSIFHQYEGAPEPTLKDAFRAIGFDVEIEDGESLTITGWEGKAWYQDEFIETISDLIDEGWFFEWTGEDDERWRVTASDTISGETVYIRPSLSTRLNYLTVLLDAYDDGHPPAGEGAAAEVSAAGPIIDAVRALIADLT